MTKVQIKALVMDVDGTLTDGKVYIGISGEIMKAFDVKDGYMIARLSTYDIIPIIITGRKSEILVNRCKELNIYELHQDVHEKLNCLNQILKSYKLSMEEVAYIGDDLNDKECIDVCGLTGCPADAVLTIRQSVDYICKNKGGNGAVREFIEYIINNNNNIIINGN